MSRTPEQSGQERGPEASGAEATPGATPGTLGVLGAGLMGSGIAQVAAVAGWDVALVDVGDAQLTRGLDGIRRSLDTLVGKERVTADAASRAMERIRTGTDPEQLADAGVVVEAVFERLDVKQETFRRLDALCRADTVLATNTSAIPISKIAAATERPESVVGTHFFSPVPLMPLCELVKGQRTSDDTVAAARGFAESVGKTCVLVQRDVAGFVTTRLISAYVMEAVRLVESGVISAEDLDTACRLGFGHPMGPLATCDLTGVDVLKHAAENIWSDTADPKFFPPELLARMVDAGELGRKTGQGFYTYDDR